MVQSSLNWWQNDARFKRFDLWLNLLWLISRSDQPIALPRTSESENLKKIRHTFSHVMAMAVQKLFPKAQVTIGPWIDYGFYYDF